MEYKKRISDIYQDKIINALNIVNICLLTIHILLLVLYIYFGARFMIFISTISIVVYGGFLFKLFDNIKWYIQFVFVEILLHMTFAVLNFGWDPGFQNWTYALLTAFFLPSLNPYDKKGKVTRPLIIGIVFIITYYLLVIILNIFHFDVFYPLPTEYNNILFTINTLVSFAGICGFTMFYTSRHYVEELELSKRADYDQLTSLYNRYLLNSIGKDRLDTAKENNTHFMIAMIDIDYFKSINDKYGHNAGDLILKELANILRMFSTKGIVCGRWGGEEFLLLSDNITDDNEFIDTVKQLHKYVEKHKFAIEKKNIKVTISVGVSKIKKNYSFAKNVKLADDNLYKAKESGRNRVIY